ncbi:MAG: PEP-CTERM sorting domain-containing protein, partial [Akkermansia sp.]|nr:PEP-CTERM sorting domain-containing protein [Akkermansia sp.]
GAIYIEGDLRIVGNENVIFENNYEIKTTNNYFRLRSIYQKKGYFTLAAKTGGNIIFYDSVHGSSAYGISFNDKYQDSEGNTQKATGNIIFSGKYTEEHLNKIIANEYKDTNRTATETQIRNSQTSTFGGKINLYGGSLQIIEGAILQSNGITVVDNSNATLKISEGELDTENNDIIVGKSNRLELEKDALISANKITIADSAILSVTSANTDVVELSLYTLSSLESYVPSVYGTTIGGTISGNLTLEAGSSYIADRANISLNGNSLYLNATNGNKIALTLHAINSPSNKVILFSNVGKVNFDSDILANNYFTGNWINDETTLVYDSEKQVVYLENVNDVIPEPTTTTLSLLALAALATRRRRK